MKIPISKRLLCCADLVPDNARVADVGCDHGYLGIYLLKNGLARHVTATDLRPKPLEKARANSQAYSVGEQMDFFVADGLGAVEPESVDTIVCAGMGGDNIAGILAAAPWTRNPAYTLILQPQTSGNDLRRWLGENGYAILEERLVEDGGFLYFTLLARFGGGRPLTPGEQYLSPQLLACGSPLLPAYFDRVLHGLQRAVDGIRASQKAEERARLPYYECALEEVRERKRQYDGT